ncbi:MAG TPA: hypothetical protein VJ728_09510 [Candidatus Binataceae bacterium]|nr:hypothetical protein [Candidatus Binataceae bacterium]
MKTCRVSCVDLSGIEHAVELSANSLYEAVAHALQIFRDNDWIEDLGRGQTTILVKVKHPETEHTVRVQDFERWLEATPRSPAEMVLKNRLRELLSINQSGTGPRHG